MKKILLLSGLAFANLAFSQNLWDGSTTSTFSTSGQAAVGQATPQTGYRFTVNNTNTTVNNGIYNRIQNDFTSTQTGIYNFLNLSSTTGTKYAIYNNVSATTSAGVYASYNAATGTGTGSKYGGYFSASGTGANYGIYSSASGGTGTRAGYFNGSTEVKGNLIVTSNNVTKFLLHAAVPTTEKYFGIVPNETDSQENWDWTRAFCLYRDGQMEKSVPVNSSSLKAFTVTPYGQADVFRIYGDGKVYATEVNVRLASSFPDYVFKQDYSLLPLDELRLYIQKEGHLPNVPNASTVESEGMNIGEMSKIMVEKIEELTLYILQQQEEMKVLKQKIETLEKR